MIKIDLRLGDTIDEMKKISDKSIDLICCDLPYGTTSCFWDIIIPFDLLWFEYKRIIKNNGVIVLFGSEPFSSLLRTSNLNWYKYDWVWEKNNASNFQLVNYQPLKIHENVSIFYNESPIMDFANIMLENMKKLNLKQKDISKLELSKNNKITGWVTNKLNGSQLPTKEQWTKICNLFKIDNEYDKIISNIKKITYNLELDDTNVIMNNKNKSGKLGHLSSINKRDFYVQEKTGYPKSILKFKRETDYLPVQKPVKLLEFLIKTYSNENELVLDNTMGSGTTGIACINTKRNFIGIEKYQNIMNTAIKRFNNEKNKNFILEKNF